MLTIKNVTIYRVLINTYKEIIMKTFTEYEIEILSDPVKYNLREAAIILDIHYITVQRQRKKLGIISIPGPKGLRPYKIKNETRTCVQENCDATFVVKPAMTKKYCSISCSSLDCSYESRRKPRPHTRKPGTNDYTVYKNRVHKLSQVVYNNNIDMINPERHVRALCGVKDGWQLDHIMTIRECYESNITPEEASHVSNLRMLPWRENLMRNYES